MEPPRPNLLYTYEYKCQSCLTASPRSGGGMNEWAEYVHSRNEHICECACLFMHDFNKPSHTPFHPFEAKLP